MPRARVSPEKRKRTARACDSCKRSKLKCNGVHPCNTCSKDSRTCTFGGAYKESDVRSHPYKRQLLDDGSDSTRNVPQSIAAQFHFPPNLVALEPPQKPLQPIPQSLHIPDLPTPVHPPEQSSPFPIISQDVPTVSKADPAGSPNPLRTQSPGNRHAAGGTEEEAVIYNFPRLLEDPSGRLQYLGDSATLSYLQIIRQDVESIDGPSPFTTDPNRHHIVENNTTLPRNIQYTNLLPEKATTDILVDSFFTNTSGLFQVFDEEFSVKLDSYYSDPLHVDPNWLCLFHLTLAIGLVMATPPPGTYADVVIKKLRTDRIDQAELFYGNARNLCDPVTRFENADLWSVQALLLMAIYTLAVSKRNAAFAYCGMASRSGFALGFHREETLAIFSTAQQALRRNLWRSVFVLDCFLAASMGRPTSISEYDCPVQTFSVLDKTPSVSSSFPTPITSQSSILGLEASVRSCRVIGRILRRVYSKRKISTKIAQDIADECGLWPETLHPGLHSRQITNAIGVYPSQGISILHVNLLYCHTVILLTRPFFLFLLNKVQKERSGDGKRPRRHGSRIESFSECCVSASCHSIILAQSALDEKYLSYRNPFVIYFIFAAALIVLTNEFFKLYNIQKASGLIESSIVMMGYCAESDPIAQRLCFILTSFRDVVDRQKSYVPMRQITIKSEDPILSFLSMASTNNSTEDFSANNTRRSSFASAPAIGHGQLTGGVTSTVPISIPPQLSNIVTPEISPDRFPRHGSLDGNDSLGDGEIDFDAFWNPMQRANNNTVPAGIQKSNTMAAANE